MSPCHEKYESAAYAPPATGIFVGSVATYIFRSYWRNQVLAGAIPALILLILSYLGCEWGFLFITAAAAISADWFLLRSPRWLILRGRHIEVSKPIIFVPRRSVHFVTNSPQLGFRHTRQASEGTNFSRRRTNLHLLPDPGLCHSTIRPTRIRKCYLIRVHQQTERSALLRLRVLNFGEEQKRPRPYLLRILKILTLPR
jgi:hypothetical protein